MRALQKAKISACNPEARNSPVRGSERNDTIYDQHSPCIDVAYVHHKDIALDIEHAPYRELHNKHPIYQLEVCSYFFRPQLGIR